MIGFVEFIKRNFRKGTDDMDQMAIIELTEQIKQLNDKIIKNQANNKTWLTVFELSNYLSISESLIRKLISSKKIPFNRVDNTGKILFKKKQIDLWLLSGKMKLNKREKQQIEILL